MSKVVLITGCSSGIGRHLAQTLSGAGFAVAATARRPQTLDDLPAALRLALDVTDPASIQPAVDALLEKFGRIDVLVNNAGFAVCGALEEIPDAQIQRLFDVNVFGVLRMVRAVVPHMRRQGGGRIINISSIAGKFPVPVGGAYSATKFALEALSDTLRFELAAFGIRVVVIEPGSIRTSFNQTVEDCSGQILANPASPYRALYAAYQRVVQSMRRGEPGPEAVTRVIVKAIRSPRPKARYLAAVPLSGRLAMHLSPAAWDGILRLLYKNIAGEA